VYTTAGEGAGCPDRHGSETAVAHTAAVVVLDAAATRVGTTLDIETTCLEPAELLVPSLADAAAAGIVEEDSQGAPPPPPRVVRLRKMKGSVPPELEWQLRQPGGAGQHVDLPRGSATRHCMNTGRPRLGKLASEELLQKVTVDPGRAAIFRRSGIHSLLIVPLVAAGRSIAPRPRPARHLSPRRHEPAGRLLHTGQRRTPATRPRAAGRRHRGAPAPRRPSHRHRLGGYESITVPMERGATLLLCTDGLVERRGTDIDVSLQELAALSLPAAGALDDLLDTLLSGMANGAYEDDVAILAARQP
jgi:hypothetical protein